MKSHGIVVGKLLTELKDLGRLGTPIVVTQLLQVSYGVVAAMMMGRVGALELGAIGLGTSLWVMIFLATLGILMSVSPLVARHTGEQDRTAIRATFQQALWLSLIVSGLSMASMQSIGGVMPLMAVNESVVELVEAYLYIHSWAMPGVCLYLVLRFFCEGTGNSKPMMWIQLSVLPINILISWVLIFGKFGFPSMGLTGAALAGAMCLWLNALLLFAYLCTAQRYKALKLFSQFQLPRFAGIQKLCKIGLPIAGLLLFESSFFGVVTLMMGSLGKVALAAHNVMVNYVTVVFMVPVGLANALMVRVGQAMGDTGLTEARFRGLVGIRTAAILMIFSAFIILFFTDEIISLYTDDKDVAALTTVLLLAAAFFQFSDGVQISTAGALRGLQDTTVPMLMSAASYWIVGAPVAWALGIYLGGGALGLCLGLVFGLTTAACLLAWRFARKSEHYTYQ